MRTTLLLTLLLTFFISARGQLAFETSGEYGRLADITYDEKIPDKLYALTLGNHIMVSTNNGGTWSILYSFPRDLAFLSGLKLLPGGKALSFVAGFNAEGELNGLYIFDLESNSIRQHFIMPNLDLNPSIVSYNIYDAAAEIILLNTSYSLNWLPFTEVYYTKDNGQKWKLIYFSDNYKTVQINNTAIAPNDPSTLFLARGLGARGDDGGLFISTNEGTTWKRRLDSIPLTPIAFNPENPQEFFTGTAISFGKKPEALYHTVDGGSTFEQIPVKWEDHILNNINIIQYDRSNPKIIWMLEENEILKSTDGGKTWASAAFSDESSVYRFGTSITINPQNSSQLAITSDAWPQISGDGGKTFTQIKNPFCLTSMVALGNYIWLYYASQGGYLSKDLATQRTKAYQIQPPYMMYMHEANMNTFPDTTINGRLFLFKRSDGFFYPAQLQYSNDDGNTVFRLPTEDYATGLKFIRKDPDSRQRYWLAYSFYNAYSTVFILDMTNPAITFTPVEMPGFGLVNAVQVIPGSNGNTVYMTIGSKVYLSEDRGLTWNEKNKGLDMLEEDVDMIYDMQVNPFHPQSIAIVTTQGIFQTTDGGNNWLLINAATDLRKIAFSNIVDGHIIASAYTSMYSESRITFSTNGGSSWTNIPAAALNYLSCTSSMDFKFYTDHADIYFATADLGIVKYQLNNLLNPQLLFLTSFTGYLRGKNAQLEWKTKNEEGLLNYQLERSTNNRDFQLINTQPATNSNGTFSYEYEDREFDALAAQYGNIYYRLKLVSLDNSFAYSDTVQLTARDMYIFPVPASDNIHLHVQGVTTPAKYKILLVDAIGRQYNVQSHNIPTGVTTITMPVKHLANGTYFMLVETRPGTIRKFKFVKQ